MIWTDLTIYSTEYIEGANYNEETGEEESPSLALSSMLRADFDAAFYCVVLFVGEPDGCRFDGSTFYCVDYVRIGTTPEAATITIGVDDGVDWTGFTERWALLETAAKVRWGEHE